jgi:hypothetical protein
VSLANWAWLFDFGSGATANMFLTRRGSGGTAHHTNWIGRSRYGGDPYLDGAVDGFRLYSRVLTAAEVADLHATGQ